MPKTKQSPVDRRAYGYGRLRKDSQKILDESPSWETKEQMKKRDNVRARVHWGDDYLTGVNSPNKPSTDPDQYRKGGRVRGDGCAVKGKSKGRMR